ncbi:glycosyltransferase family 92 protein [Rhizorhabdus sp. FW153]|uniref:glycosyltransferase family 92 protein n=1 Tax=Rhizorhabdus sp. FW153 TaxID=3400216 RepID=UPI003CE8E227
MAAIIKDEAPYLAEWLEYHMLQGVEHVYIYDNGSSDRPLDVLDDYIVQGRVTFLSWPEFPGQLSAYSHAMNIFGRDTDWMMVIDVDEFVQSTAGQNIIDVLSTIGDNADQLLLAWIHFGSSGHEEKPEGLVVENFIHRSVEAHRQTKFIVRPESVATVGVHHCETLTGRTVDCLGRPAHERWIQPAPLPMDVRVNHYFTKSRAEFAAKIARGQSDGGTGKKLADFDRFETPMLDESLAAMGTIIRAAMEATRKRPRHFSVHAPWSAQSELVFSDQWFRAVRQGFASFNDAIAANEAAKLSITTDLGRLTGLPCSPSDANDLATSVQTMVGATSIIDLSGNEWPLDISLDQVSHFGRPYLVWQGWSAESVEAKIIVDGIDGGGKAWQSERAVDMERGDNLIAMILSDRTIVVQRVRILCDMVSECRTIFSRMYSFI